MRTADPAPDSANPAVDPSQGLDRFFADATGRASVGAALPDGAIVRFVIHGEGTWTLIRQGARVEIVEPPHPSPDCHLACASADFRALVDGSLDPREGYLAGRLELTGDVGIVLGLRRALGVPRRATGT